MLRKGVYPYEYIDSWKRFDETLLPEKFFYSNLNMKSLQMLIIKHAKRVWKGFNIKNLGEYYSLYV